MSSEIRPVSGSRPTLPAPTQDRASVGAQSGKPAASAASSDAVRVETGPATRFDEAPVDAERVGQIRAALKDGTYPILPARIADAMVAARLMLSSSE